MQAVKLARNKTKRYLISFESFMGVDTFPQGVSPSVHQESVVEIYLCGEFPLALQPAAVAALRSALFP